MPLVLYLTTDCNMQCEYCYEADNRELLKDKQQQLNIETVRAELDKIKDTASDGSCIVLFGGEPFLNFPLMKQIIDLNHNEYHDKFSFSTNTNGTLLTDEMLTYLKEQMEYTPITVSISYDGHGNYRRKFKDGSSVTEIVESKIDLINSYDMPFAIGYTIHKGNFEINRIIRDFVLLFEKYKNISKIEVNFDAAELEPLVGDATEHISLLLAKCVSLYKIYGKKICCYRLNSSNRKEHASAICLECGECNADDRRIYVTDKNVIVKSKDENDAKFNQWEYA